MEDFYLFVIACSLFLFVYFIMKQIDCLIDSCEYEKEIENKKKLPACILLSENLTDEEMIKEIKIFKKNHHGIKIFLLSDQEEIVHREGK